MERVSFKRQYFNRSSIEINAHKSNKSIELPEEIESLITGNDYWKQAKRNRYKKLIREGYLSTLLQLAQLAHQMATREHPSHWFAKYASKAQWERTLSFLAKLSAVQRTAERVAQKLGTAVTKFIYKQVWQGLSVERWAAMAAEIGVARHKAKYFAWLCQREITAGAM